jgi:hypothetical protein
MKAFYPPLLLGVVLLLPSTVAQTDRPADRPLARVRERLRQSRPGPDGPGPLTEDQRSVVRGTLKQAAEASRQPAQELREAREKLHRLVRSGRADEAAIREQAGAIARLEGDLAMIRVRASGDLHSKLPPAKVKRLEALGPVLRERLAARWTDRGDRRVGGPANARRSQGIVGPGRLAYAPGPAWGNRRGPGPAWQAPNRPDRGAGQPGWRRGDQPGGNQPLRALAGQAPERSRGPGSAWHRPGAGSRGPAWQRDGRAGRGWDRPADRPRGHGRRQDAAPGRTRGSEDHRGPGSNQERAY